MSGPIQKQQGFTLVESMVSLVVLSVGMIEADTGADHGADHGAASGGLPFDYIWLSDRAERPDPCEGFG